MYWPRNSGFVTRWQVILRILVQTGGQLFSMQKINLYLSMRYNIFWNVHKSRNGYTIINMCTTLHFIIFMVITLNIYSVFFKILLTVLTTLDIDLLNLFLLPTWNCVYFYQHLSQCPTNNLSRWWLSFYHLHLWSQSFLGLVRSWRSFLSVSS